ncbi:hypothetical protein AURDEDRAFT_113298 [Auricularia subglabra TFB-10046 SS5]|nr:hypothetical protein AURDEDRAFT_113298 [Auricularia subglabra TFB-10046 SS5]
MKNNVDNGAPRPVRDVELHLGIKPHHDLHPHSQLYSARSKPAPGSEPVTCYGFNSNGSIKFKHKLFTDAINEDNDTTISDDDDACGEDVGTAITIKRDGMAFHISQWLAMPDAHQSAFEKRARNMMSCLSPRTTWTANLFGRRAIAHSSKARWSNSTSMWTAGTSPVRQVPRRGHRDGEPYSHRCPRCKTARPPDLAKEAASR